MSDTEMPENQTGLEMASVEAESTTAIETTEPSKPEKSAMRPPSRRLSLQLEGRDYLDYLMLSERILFSERLTSKQKDERILQLALELLHEALDRQNEMFVPAERLQPRRRTVR